MKDGAGGQDADVHSVTVTDDVLLAGRLGAELPYAVAAEGAGDEAVEGRAVI